MGRNNQKRNQAAPVKNIHKNHTGIIIAVVALIVIMILLLMFYGAAAATTANAKIAFTISDAPTPLGAVSALNMRILNISVHSNTTGKWYYIPVSTSGTYNLVTLNNIYAIVGNATLPTGNYDEVVIKVGSVAATMNGNTTAVVLPSSTLKIFLSFKMFGTPGASSTNWVNLDVNTSKSLHATGNGRIIMLPVIQVTARQNAVLSVQPDNTASVTLWGTPPVTEDYGMNVDGTMQANLAVPQNANLTVAANGTIESENGVTGTIVTTTISEESTEATSIAGGYGNSTSSNSTTTAVPVETLGVQPSSLPEWVSGKYGSASFTFMINGGTPPYYCSLERGSSLPSGLELSGACVISGTHTLSQGTTKEISPPFTVAVTDSAHPAASATVTLTITTISKAPVLMPMKGECPGGIGYYCLTQVANATGGTPPYTFSSDTFAGGAPPIGMTLGTDGNLTGTPSAGGTYDFGVCVTDMVGAENCTQTSVAIASPTTWELDMTGTLTNWWCEDSVYGESFHIIVKLNNSVVNSTSGHLNSTYGNGTMSGTTSVSQQSDDDNCTIEGASFSDIPVGVGTAGASDTIYLYTKVNSSYLIPGAPNSIWRWDLYGDQEGDNVDGWNLTATHITPTEISGMWDVIDEGQSGTFVMTKK
jgi:hypothetical protein